MPKPKPKRALAPDAYWINAPLAKIVGNDSEMNSYDYLQTLVRREWESPEQHLAQAVLEDAVSALRGASIYGSMPKGKAAQQKDKQAREARDWFLADEDELIFSFISICQCLRIDPNYLRKKILKLEPLKDREK